MRAYVYSRFLKLNIENRGASSRNVTVYLFPCRFAIFYDRKKNLLLVIQDPKTLDDLLSEISRKRYVDKTLTPMMEFPDKQTDFLEELVFNDNIEGVTKFFRDNFYQDEI